MLVYVASAAGLWLLWQIVRRVLYKSPLLRVPGPPSNSFLSGNFSQLFETDGWSFHDDLTQYGQVSRVTGMLSKPWLYVGDPKTLYSILLKDNQSWDEPSMILDSNDWLLGPGLLSVGGETHRRQRKMLMPVFSVKHLRNMVPVFYQVSRNLVQAISSRVEGGPAQVDLLNWMSRTALEMIGQSGMGYSFDPLVEDVADDYVDAVKNFLPNATTPLVSMVRTIVPNASWKKKVSFMHGALDLIPSKNVSRLAQIVDMLATKSKEIYESKKAAAEQSGGVGEAKDIMSILLKENMEAAEADKLPDDQLMGQISTILFAAMDTTSNALARTLQLLSEHPDVQEKLRLELRQASGGEDIEYDELHRLPFLDAICRETLRLHSPVTFVFRETKKDTILPLSEPIRATDGAIMDEIPAPRGTTAILSIRACNRSKAIWGEDAEEWKPERWLQPLRPEVENASVPGVYSHLMTFLGGGRACIGFKLSQLEMKLILSVLVQNFAFERGNKPIVWNLSGVSYAATSSESDKPEMWLTVRKL